MLLWDVDVRATLRIVQYEDILDEIFPIRQPAPRIVLRERRSMKI